jgi:hypothetical protein
MLNLRVCGRGALLPAVAAAAALLGTLPAILRQMREHLALDRVDPFMGRLARNAIQVAKLADAEHLAQIIRSELSLLVHR